MKESRLRADETADLPKNHRFGVDRQNFDWKWISRIVSKKKWDLTGVDWILPEREGIDKSGIFSGIYADEIETIQIGQTIQIFVD